LIVNALLKFPRVFNALTMLEPKIIIEESEELQTIDVASAIIEMEESVARFC